MFQNNKLFSIKNNIDSVILGIIGSFLIYIFTRYGGIGLEPDSIVYLSTARSVVQGGGFFEFEGIPLTDFPLGYPAFLGLIQLITRVDLLQSAPIINMLLYFVLIYLSGSFLNELTSGKKWIKLCFLVIIVLSPALLNSYTMLMSETLFILLVLVFIATLRQYGREKTIRSLIIVALVAGFSCTVRYAGITLVLAGGLIVLSDMKLNWSKKLIQLIVYGSVGISFLLLNILRNYLITNSFTGPRESSITPISENIKNYVLVLSDFYKYDYLPYFFVLLIGILLFGYFSFTFIFKVRKSKKHYSIYNIAAVFFIVYSIFIISIASISRFETLNGRLLLPLFLTGLLPLAFVVKELITKLKGWARYCMIIILFFVFGVISFYQFKDNANLLEMANNSGIPGYAEDVWRESALLKYIRTEKQSFNEQTKIYSNGNEAIYLFAGLKADLIPHVEYESEIAEFKENQLIDYYIVWFYDNEDPELLDINQLQKEYDLIQTVSAPEGKIYFHKAK